MSICPPSKKRVPEQYDWAKQDLEGKVGNSRFLQFFAVHEVEAWLLSDVSIFPHEVRESLEGKIEHPEEVDFDEPPAQLLKRAYKSNTGRGYLKVTQGQQLFNKLDPSVSYGKCPYLKQLLDKMLEIAQNSQSKSN